MPDQKIPLGTYSDINSGVDISKVHNNYFSNNKNADIFCEIGIRPILSELPKSIKLIDFGGGMGFLTKSVKDYLEKNNFKVEAIVLDANERFLVEAKKQGLKTVKTAIQLSKINDADIIISRALIHYNQKEDQQNILDIIFKSLKTRGFFIHQNSSGTKENCKLRSDIVNSNYLGRTPEGFKYNWVDENKCLDMSRKVGFQKSYTAGYAPGNSWGPEEQWDRFNKKETDIAETENNLDKLGEIEIRKKNFLTKSKELIELYISKWGLKDIKKDDDEKYTITYSYPIIICKK
jgi:hypothetical protein